MKEIIKYFISFNYKSKDVTGLGNLEIDRIAPIEGFEDIQDMQEYIAEKNEMFGNVVILNWKRFEKAEE